MKKLLICLALAFSLVTLGACGKNESAKPTSSTNNHQSKGQGQVTLILKTEKESKKKSVEIQKGDTVLDVLEEVYPVQENDGFITEIDGKKISSKTDIQTNLYSHSIGDTIKVTFYRGKDKKTVDLKLTKSIEDISD